MIMDANTMSNNNNEILEIISIDDNDEQVSVSSSSSVHGDTASDGVLSEIHDQMKTPNAFTLLCSKIWDSMGTLSRELVKQREERKHICDVSAHNGSDLASDTSNMSLLWSNVVINRT